MSPSSQGRRAGRILSSPIRPSHLQLGRWWRHARAITRSWRIRSSSASRPASEDAMFAGPVLSIHRHSSGCRRPRRARPGAQLARTFESCMTRRVHRGQSFRSLPARQPQGVIPRTLGPPRRIRCSAGPTTSGAPREHGRSCYASAFPGRTVSQPHRPCRVVTNCMTIIAHDAMLTPAGSASSPATILGRRRLAFQRQLESTAVTLGARLPRTLHSGRDFHPARRRRSS